MLEARQPIPMMTLLELVGRRLGCGLGDWVIEIKFEHGQVVWVRRHERIGARALDERFPVHTDP